MRISDWSSDVCSSDLATFTSSSDAAVVFAGFEPFEERLAQGITSDAIIGNLFGRMQAVEEAFIIAVPPPPVAGVGRAGGFKLQLRDLNSAEMARVLQAAYAIMGQRSEEHTSELQSLMRSTYAVFC